MHVYSKHYASQALSCLKLLEVPRLTILSPHTECTKSPVPKSGKNFYSQYYCNKPVISPYRVSYRRVGWTDGPRDIHVYTASLVAQDRYTPLAVGPTSGHQLVFDLEFGPRPRHPGPEHSANRAAVRCFGTQSREEPRRRDPCMVAGLGRFSTLGVRARVVARRGGKQKIGTDCIGVKKYRPDSRLYSWLMQKVLTEEAPASSFLNFLPLPISPVSCRGCLEPMTMYAATEQTCIMRHSSGGRCWARSKFFVGHDELSQRHSVVPIVG